jgi:chemotaxis protein MotB
MTTFSDMMTLLLAFFVLLLSMSGLDGAALARISARMRDPASVGVVYGGATDRQFADIVKEPANPAGYRELFVGVSLQGKSNEAVEGVSVLEHREGVVIVLTETLLFRPGSALLEPSGKKLLDALTPAIKALDADVNISGYTDSGPAQGLADPAPLYDLSFSRAAAALEHFLQAGVRADRFSVAGYGPDKELYPNDASDGGRKNRRLEILVKTVPRAASYI